MTAPSSLVRHYAAPSLLERVRAGLVALGKVPEQATLDDLAPVEEFHIGGRAATAEFLEQLGLRGGDRLLEVGCGLGGTARFAADRFGVLVLGLDLSPDFIEAGRELTRWTRLESRVELEVADASRLDLAAGSFDAATLLHVGMNISDKAALAANLAALLRPGGTLGIYDVMRVGAGEFEFPLPWASEASESHVETPEQYRLNFEAAGLVCRHERVRRQFALDFFKTLAARRHEDGPPPLGLHLVMGANAKDKMRRLVELLEGGVVAPVEMIFTRP